MPSKSAGSPAGDGIDLRDDGTVAVEWDDRAFTLRRPKVREWSAYMEGMAAADEWLEKSKPVTGATLAGDDNAYRAIYVQVLNELGNPDEPVTADDLPLWMLDGKLLARLNVHWLALPLRPSEGNPTATASR